MKDIILFALTSEAPNLFKEYPNAFEIGVGKVNAAINTKRLIHKYAPDRIINLGTAGGISVDSGIYRINRVIQHDVNLQSLGLIPGYHLEDNHSVINLPGDGKCCGSGDIFVTEPKKLRVDCDIVDMEAYSIAKAAQINGITVEIYKYISDSADTNATNEWQQNINKGEELFFNVLKELSVSKD
jgi:adenosylhomocysteine nucleosidase